MSKWHVVMTDSVFPSLDVAKAEFKAVDADFKLLDGKDELDTPDVLGADAILTTYAQLRKDLVERLDNCKIIARCGIGVDNIDVAACTNRGIWVSNVTDYCLDEVSDHALGLILAVVRKIPQLNESLHKGQWVKNSGVPIPRLGNLTLGLVGFGKIARYLKNRAAPLGMRTLAFDPGLSDAEIEKAGAKAVPFEKLLSESDVISLHCPLTNGTRHLFNAESLSNMKRGSFLINTSRGGLVDEDALRKAIESGHLAGAGIDVFENEGAKYDTPLRGVDNVILTPHIAFYSQQSVMELLQKASHQIAKVLSGDVPDYPVNHVS